MWVGAVGGQARLFRLTYIPLHCDIDTFTTLNNLLAKGNLRILKQTICMTTAFDKRTFFYLVFYNKIIEYEPINTFIVKTSTLRGVGGNQGLVLGLIRI